MPPQFDGNTLSYIDLDIDILVEPDMSYKILDLEDFEENARKYSYPADVQDQAQRGLAEVVRLIETQSFPFNVA